MSPTLAELSINLNSLPSMKVILGCILTFIAVISVGIPTIRKYLLQLQSLVTPTVSKSTNPEMTRSSDQAPPEGFVAHLTIIKEAAPKGNPTVWWDYATKGLSEAEVAKAEAALVERKAN